MRTTLSLDDDVAAMLKRVMEKKKSSFKEVVNEALRMGLAGITAPRRRSRNYRTACASVGRCLIGSLDDIAEALAIGEEEQFR